MRLRLKMILEIGQKLKNQPFWEKKILYQIAGERKKVNAKPERLCKLRLEGMEEMPPTQNLSCISFYLLMLFLSLFGFFKRELQKEFNVRKPQKMFVEKNIRPKKQLAREIKKNGYRFFKYLVKEIWYI